MFALTFLGTSASVPSAERNHSGLLIEVGSQRILVDCGEGTQRQLLRSGAGFRRLARLLLTHGHFDHVLGIPGLFSTLRLRRSAELMTIHGSPGTLDVVVRMLAGLWGEGKVPIPLELVIEPKCLRSAAFRYDIARPIASDSPLRAGRAGIFGQTASRSSEYRTAPCAGSWRKESG
jgi:ribonuclease BN (tRNA processing enzyme)